MYGMQKTTVYLPDDLKQRLADEALIEQTSEAEIIRSAIEARVSRPKPRGGLFSSTEISSERVDEQMVGFGER